MWAGQYWNGLNQGRYGCLCFLDSGSVEFEVFKKVPAVCVSKSLGDRNHEGLQRLEELIFPMTLQSRNVGNKYAYVVHSDEQSFWLIFIPVSLDWLLPRLSYNNHHRNGCIISQVKSLRCPNFGGSSARKFLPTEVCPISQICSCLLPKGQSQSH